MKRIFTLGLLLAASLPAVAQPPGGSVLAARGHYSDPRPKAWCGWWLRQHLGVKDKAFNLARHWQNYGSPAGGPAVGTIVVWPHHVGIVTGRGANGWIVKSGNDGHRVRERERSLRGAIAFRWPQRSNHVRAEGLQRHTKAHAKNRRRIETSRLAGVEASITPWSGAIN